MASSRSPLDWFNYQVGMHTFRAFAQGKATWILNYSWDGDKKVDPREAMKNLAMSQVMDNANFWDAPGHSMAGSNDARHSHRNLSLDRSESEGALLATFAYQPRGCLLFSRNSQLSTPMIF